MDKLKMRLAMMQGLGEDARQRRLKKQKDKYAGLSPEMAADMAKQDEVVDAAAMPDMSGADVSDLPTDKWNTETKQAIADADPLEDEEMQKWMAKQRG